MATSGCRCAAGLRRSSHCLGVGQRPHPRWARDRPSTGTGPTTRSREPAACDGNRERSQQGASPQQQRHRSPWASIATALASGHMPGPLRLVSDFDATPSAPCGHSATQLFTPTTEESILNILTCQQGDAAWHEARSRHYCASDASAAMGLSRARRAPSSCASARWPYREHRRREAGAVRSRPCRRGRGATAGRGDVDDELYPCVGTAEVDGLPLLTSFDGLTIDGSIVWGVQALQRGAGGRSPGRQPAGPLLAAGRARAVGVWRKAPTSPSPMARPSAWSVCGASRSAIAVPPS